MTCIFDHPPDAICTCAVCGYHQALPGRPPVNDTADFDDEPTPAIAKLRGGRAGASTHTIPCNRLTREERRLRTLLVYPPGVERPRTRGDCIDGPRPCPWISCRWHLYLDVTPSGSIKLNHPSLEPWELDESCALDVADQGGVTLEALGKIMGITRERIRQVEVRAVQRVGAASVADLEAA